MENNNVKLVGKIAKELKFNHETLNEKFYETELRVKRLSGDYDQLKIIISERLLLDIEVNENDVVEVEGNIRSYNYFIKETNKRRLLINVFVKALRPLEEKEYKDDPEILTTNEVHLIGTICKKPVYRKTPFGREIADMLIAVNRPYGKSDYLPCIAWGRNARFSNNLNVGQIIKVSGRAQSRMYNKVKEDGNEEERIAYEISIKALELPREDIDNLVDGLDDKESNKETIEA